jgi:protein SCO1/2
MTYSRISLLIALFTVLVVLISGGCKEEGDLPILGNTAEVDGQKVYHQIRDWTYLNQDSIQVTNKDLGEYVYVADFFFTSCPSICPRVAKEMLVIYEEFKDEPRVKLVSFTIDPKRDTPTKLKLYSSNLDVNSDKWWFLTGDKGETLELANDYFIAALEDQDSPGGFDHSGKIVLVDKEGHIRSFSEGTDPDTTPKLIKDVKKLIGK